MGLAATVGARKRGGRDGRTKEKGSLEGKRRGETEQNASPLCPTDRSFAPVVLLPSPLPSSSGGPTLAGVVHD